jgi:adenosylmethionine-8-amino-7-oxononanoate aminotransferase
MIQARGNYLFLDNGQKILDACGGAGVACIGHGRQEVARAMASQAAKFSYISWAHFDNQPARDLSRWLIDSTGGRLSKVYIMCSGTTSLKAPSRRHTNIAEQAPKQ